MVAAASIMLVSCSDDLDGGGGGTDNIASTVDLQSGMDLVTSVTMVSQGGTFSVNLVASAGTDLLKAVEVLEDGVSIPASRIQYDGVTAASNPKSLFNDQVNSIDFVIQVNAHTEIGTRSYRFSVIDDLNEVESVSVEVTTEGTPPALTLNGTASLDLNPGSLNNVNLTAVKGSGAIASIGVTVDGSVIDIADLAFDGVDFISNPDALQGDLVDGFTMKALTFRAPMADGSYLYNITITDEFGQESSVEFTVNIALEMLMGVLFNSGGPIGQGGLDLDNGLSTGTQSTDIEAEIKDQGIDGDGNWLQLIAPFNGSRMYLMTPGEDGVSESFTFASIQSKEALDALNGSGLEIAISGTVVAGQVYVVERDGNVYAFEVAEVNVVQADNSDNYVLNIVK